jgi:hypothetical protein
MGHIAFEKNFQLRNRRTSSCVNQRLSGMSGQAPTNGAPRNGTVVIETRSELFRRRAAEMRREAQYVVDETLRYELLKLAAGWDRLADHGQILAAPPEGTPSGTDVPPGEPRADKAAIAH